MTTEEKKELIDLVKSDIKKTAELEAKGQFEKAEEARKSLQDKLDKSLETLVTKEEFDKMETSFKKQISDFEAKQKASIDFTGEMVKSLTDNAERLTELAKGAEKNVQLDLQKAPGVMTSASSLGVTNATEGFAVNNNREIVPIARRRDHVRSAFGMGTTDDAIYPFLRETPKEGVVDVQNPEGSAKSQTEYQASLVTASASTIATFQLIGRQTLRNVRGLASFINTMLVSDLLLKEDQQLLFGTGANSQVLGVFTSPLTSADLLADLPLFKVASANKFDAIGSACALMANREYSAGAVMVHPVDYWAMVLEKDSTNNYLSTVVFDTTTGRLYVNGIPVISTTAVALGSFGVADTMYVMPLQYQGISLRFFEQDSDNVQKNLVTARIEEEIINVVRRSDAFYYDTFANTIAQITA